MKARKLIPVVLFSLTLTAGATALARLSGGAGAPAPDDPKGAAMASKAETEADPAIESALVEVFGELSTPGVVAGIARWGDSTRVASHGVRCKGKDEPMTPGDRMHIGSDTKAMTAVLIARLVDRGRMTWETTVAEALPKLARNMHKDCREITVTQLLRHTAGMPRDAKDWRLHGSKKLTERRRLIAAEALKSKPVTSPGETYEYSNLGVMIAGAMAEAVEGKPWEELMRAEVFGPLGITTAGFGPPSLKGSLDQPWGHNFGVIPIQGDNDPALGPAGTVHLSVGDWARFVLEFTESATKESKFLKAATRERLVQVGQSGYAYGWGVTERRWAGGTALTHSGSNTYWFATVWVAPSKDRAYLIAANAADPATQRAVDQMVGELLKLDK